MDALGRRRGADVPRRTLCAVDSCFVRAAPRTSGAALGRLRRGETVPWGGGRAVNGWLPALYRGRAAWVSGRFTHLE